MYRFDNRIHFSRQQSSIGSAILVLLLMMVGFIVIGPFIGMIAALPFIEGSVFEMTKLMAPPYDDPSQKTPIYIIQGFATAIGTILIPALFFMTWEKTSLHQFTKRQIPLGFTTILIFLIGFTFMGFNAFFIEWNQELEFPEFMKGFEEWARTTEESAAEITTFLTRFDSVGQFLLAFVVIAVLPSIGEELVFRGLLQNYFAREMNIHVAIWLSAMLFSLIHFQFFGFVPRMLLGALFGYLYYWSANLWVPIIAHFFNNGFTILVVYLHQQQVINFDIESTESTPWYIIIIFGVLSFLLLRYFYNFFKNYYTQYDAVEERVQDPGQDQS